MVLERVRQHRKGVCLALPQIVWVPHSIYLGHDSVHALQSKAHSVFTEESRLSAAKLGSSSKSLWCFNPKTAAHPNALNFGGGVREVRLLKIPDHGSHVDSTSSSFVEKLPRLQRGQLPVHIDVWKQLGRSRGQNHQHPYHGWGRTSSPPKARHLHRPAPHPLPRRLSPSTPSPPTKTETLL